MSGNLGIKLINATTDSINPQVADAPENVVYTHPNPPVIDKIINVQIANVVGNASTLISALNLNTISNNVNDILNTLFSTSINPLLPPPQPVSAYPSPTDITSLNGASIFGSYTPIINYGNKSYFVRLPQKFSKNVNINWPLLSIVKDLNKINTNIPSIVTASMSLVILANNKIIIDAATGQPVLVQNIVPEIQLVPDTPGIALQNVVVNTGSAATNTYLQFTAQFFLFRTDTILNTFTNGNYTFAIVLLTDYNGLVSRYAVIINNTTGYLVSQSGESAVELTFGMDNKTCNWVAIYDTPNDEIDLNLLFQQLVKNVQPAIISVDPNSGPLTGGYQVTISGYDTDFNGTSQVFFSRNGNNVTAFPVTVNNPTSITVTVPDYTLYGPGPVNVIVNTSNVVVNGTFTYTVPTITAYPISSSAAGTIVAITGTNTNFNGTTVVDFGGFAPLTTTVNSSTSITVTTPAHAPGTILLTATTGSEVASTTFTFV
jgi:hypothetical protein